MHQLGLLEIVIVAAWNYIAAHASACLDIARGYSRIAKR